MTIVGISINVKQELLIDFVISDTSYFPSNLDAISVELTFLELIIQSSRGPMQWKFYNIPFSPLLPGPVVIPPYSHLRIMPDVSSVVYEELNILIFVLSIM